MGRKNHFARIGDLSDLVRIALYEDRLHAAIVVNAKALEEASAYWIARRAQHVSCGGPCTRYSGGGERQHPSDQLWPYQQARTPALDGFVPPYGLTLVKNLRDLKRHHSRQDGDDGARQLGSGRAFAHARQLQRDRRIWHEPLRPAPGPRDATFDGRPALATGGSSSGIRYNGQFLGHRCERGHRNVGLHPGAYRNQNMLAGIKPTVGRVSQPLWGYSDNGRSGHARPDG